MKPQADRISSPLDPVLAEFEFDGFRYRVVAIWRALRLERYAGGRWGSCPLSEGIPPILNAIASTSTNALRFQAERARAEIRAAEAEGDVAAAKTWRSNLARVEGQIEGLPGLWRQKATPDPTDRRHDRR